MEVYELTHGTKGTSEEPQSERFGNKGALGKSGGKSQSQSHQITLQIELQTFFKALVFTFNILSAKLES